MARAGRIDSVEVAAFVIPTDRPEADGTLAWDKTTLVTVEVAAGGRRGLGYTYADVATARLVQRRLAGIVEGADPFDVPRAFEAMLDAIRNLGRPGIASMAISAVDVALWDLKARLLDVSLVSLLGRVRESVPVYGSGGFTSYPDEALASQLEGWARDGIGAVKMKVGADPERDPERVRIARKAVGEGVRLMVDANGAYPRKRALAMADDFARHAVTWFEEPVSSDDLPGLRAIRDRAPAGMEIAAGEYGYDPFYFRRMLEAEAVDVLQIDGSRCGGITGFLRAAALCEAHALPASAHTAPTIHAQVGCAVRVMRDVEWFHDHARIEALLFDGAPAPVRGRVAPDPSRPGMGIEFKRKDAERFAV